MAGVFGGCTQLHSPTTRRGQRMDQSQGSLTPYASARHFLGAELRRWRHTRQLSVAELARQVYVSRELLQKVETAQRRASADLIRACDRALDTGGTLGRLLDFVTHTEQTLAAVPQPTPPQNILIKIIAELVAAEPPNTQPAAVGHQGLAKVYPLTGRRQRMAVVLDPLGRGGNAAQLTVTAAEALSTDPTAAGDD